MPPITEIHFITGNANKYAELKTGFETRKVVGIELKTAAVEVHEIQGTVEEIATFKCKQAAEKVNGPVLTEDTCLYFDALNGLPGPYIKDFVKCVGEKNFHTLLQGYENKRAEAVCTFAYSDGPEGEPILFQGRTKGKIVPSRGDTKFGWDPVFEYEGKTFAEMSKTEKNAISHRGKAVDKLVDWLQSRQN